MDHDCPPPPELHHSKQENSEPQKRLSADQIIAQLRKPNVETATKKKVPAVRKLLEVAERTYYQWRQKYGGMKREMTRQLNAL